MYFLSFKWEINLISELAALETQYDKQVKRIPLPTYILCILLYNE